MEAIAFSLLYNRDDRTFTKEEIDSFQQAIIKALNKKLAAKVR